MILTRSLRCRNGITLVELLIAVTLLGIIAAAGTAIDFTSRMALIRGTKRVDVRGKASFAMEHMVRHIRFANKISPTSGTATTINLWIDDNNTADNMADDTKLTYSFSANRILFSDTDHGISNEVITDGVVNCRFGIDSWPGNYPHAVTITITLRKLPGQSESANNPEVTLKSRANLWCRGRGGP